MSKKLLIGIIPLLAIATYAVMPVAVQAATQHWYRDGVSIPPGEPTPIVGWGPEVNLSQTSGQGEVNCKTVIGGMVENPSGGASGKASFNAAAFYECKAPQCEAQLAEKGLVGRESVEARNMPAAINGHPERNWTPWTVELEEGTVEGVFSVRLKIGQPFVTFKTPSPPGMIRIANLCEIAASETTVSEAIFEGELKPEIGAAKKGNLNGTGHGKPSSMRFEGASTGALHSSLAGAGTYLGTLKIRGYNEQELITVK